MTDAERLLLLVTADTLLRMADNPCVAVDVSRLAAARHALDVEAHQSARHPLTVADNGQVTDWRTRQAAEAAALAAHRKGR